jgi:hypothetical protein
MASNEWTWATLSAEQINLLREGEKTLGADYLVAYQRQRGAGADGGDLSQYGLSVARLDESQLECLQGLEEKMDAVVIAYQGNGS